MPSERLASVLKLRMESILEALSEGVAIIDADGVIQAVNEAAERILGAPRALMTGSDRSVWLLQRVRCSTPTDRSKVRSATFATSRWSARRTLS